MKRFKKAALALLSGVVMAGPLLSSCSPAEEGSSSGQVEASVKSIAITTNPTKVDYESGDVFDPTGMVVTATYSDGSSKAVTDYTYSRLPLTVSDKRVKITYKGKSAYVDITVVFVVKCTSIKVEDMPKKTKYVVGERFDPTGMKVVGEFNDNTKKVITDYEWDKTGPLEATDNVIQILYKTLKTTVAIEVDEVTLAGIEITSKPTKLAYLVGEKFDASGLEVSSFTNDGKRIALAKEDYSIDKTEALTEKDTKVTITYKEFTASINISVSESKLLGIEIQGSLTKSTYWEGDALSLEGIRVVAKYEDGQEATLSPDRYEVNKTILSKDDTEVTISFGGYSQNIAITVKEKIVSVNVDGLKTVRVEAEHLDTSKAALRNDFIAAGRTFIEEGDNASNGQNICGYNPGSIFEIPINSDKDCEILITARMSDTNTNYKINDGVRFAMDDNTILAQDVKFTYAGGNDYWAWKDVIIGKISLTAGKHLFSLTSINQRPNLDCFDFKVLKYGDQVAERKLTGITMTSRPTKTVYTAGETFDPTGMVIEASYDDYTKEVVTNYTIDKTGPLTEEDDSVTITLGAFSLVVNIQVGKYYTAKINELGTKKVEAENLRFDGLKHRTDISGDYVIDNTLASGNKSIERYDNGSVFTLPLLVNEDSKTKFVIAAADANAYQFDSKVTVKLDDNLITSNNPTMGPASNNQYYNWKEVDFGFLELEKGEHTITIEMTNARPNLDYVSFETVKYGTESVPHTLKELQVVSLPSKTTYLVGETFDPTGMVVKGVYADGEEETITDYTIDKTGALTLEDKEVTIAKGDLSIKVKISVQNLAFTANEAGESKVEAEDCNTSNLVGDGSSFIENCGSYGNGKSLGHIKSGYIDILFKVEEEMNLTIEMSAAKFEPYNVSQQVKSFEIDGKTAKFEDVKMGQTTGNQYFNFKPVAISCGKLEVGLHSFRITFQNGGLNVDCFNFKFSK